MKTRVAPARVVLCCLMMLAAGVLRAQKTVEIPEGTSVVIHLYGWNGNFALGLYQVIQVDQDVVVDGIVVVPRGSLGLVGLEHGEQGDFRWDEGVQTVGHSLFGPVQKHVVAPKKKGYIRYSFKGYYVLSIASTHLDLDQGLNIFDVDHKNAKIGQYGLECDIESEFTMKLKHAVLTLPPAQ
jgi:hypothetical protein